MPSGFSQPTVGIYLIWCRKTSRFYVGKSEDISRRWDEHYAALNAGKHPNALLQREWNQYGSDAFVFLIYAFLVGGYTWALTKQPTLDWEYKVYGPGWRQTTVLAALEGWALAQFPSTYNNAPTTTRSG